MTAEQWFKSLPNKYKGVVKQAQTPPPGHPYWSTAAGRKHSRQIYNTMSQTNKNNLWTAVQKDIPAFKNIPGKPGNVKQAQLSREPSGNLNLNISPEVQELIKRFGIAAGASLIPNGIINAMRGDKLLHNALPVAAVSGGAYAAYPQVIDKLKDLKNNYMSRYNQ